MPASPLPMPIADNQVQSPHPSVPIISPVTLPTIVTTPPTTTTSSMSLLRCVNLPAKDGHGYLPSSNGEDNNSFSEAYYTSDYYGASTMNNNDEHFLRSQQHQRLMMNNDGDGQYRISLKRTKQKSKR